MDQIEIYLEKNTFNIVSTKELTNLRIWNKETSEEIPFLAVGAGHYQLAATKILCLLDTTKKDRAYIFWGEHHEIDLTHIQLKSPVNDPRLQLIINGVSLTLYVSFKNTLRFMCNLLPSIKGYYLKNQIEKISSDHDTVTLDLAVYTKFFALKFLDFKITHRQLDKSDLLADIKSVTSERIDLNTFINHFKISFQPAQQLHELEPNIKPNGYNWQFFDLRISLHFAEFKTRPQEFRVAYNSACNVDCVVPYPNNLLLHLYWYGTNKYNNLTYRIDFVPKDTYQTYLSFKNGMQSVQTNTHKKIVLISEYPQKAQDNGFALFKYLIQKKSPEFDPYYIITEDSPDLHNLKKYMKHVVFYNSPEHVKKFMQATVLCHTHSSYYALPFRNNLFVEKEKKIQKVFLQHGITAVRNVEHLYGKNTHPDFTNKFIVSSERERQLIVHKLDYADEDVVLTGLARFDLLLKHNNPFTSYIKRKRVLLMPTWREGVVNLSDKDFVKTEYFKKINGLLHSKKLLSLKHKQHLTIDFYLHTNFQKFSHLFHSDEINIMCEGHQTVQSILKSHGILITDFSSVGLDFALLKRPVLYYQFDGPDVNDAFNDHPEDLLPGPIITKEDELILELSLKVKNNRLDDKYAKKISQNIYKFQDKHARDRIFQVLRTLV